MMFRPESRAVAPDTPHPIRVNVRFDPVTAHRRTLDLSGEKEGEGLVPSFRDATIERTIELPIADDRDSAGISTPPGGPWFGAGGTSAAAHKPLPRDGRALNRDSS
jgi:hypothetical protein